MISRLVVPYLVQERLIEIGKSHENTIEVGGILIGSYRGPHIEVRSITEPGATDQSLPFSFVKQDETHQKQAMEAWQKSGHYCTYLGEWHTHPSGLALPSSQDIATWRRITKLARAHMIFCIVTPKDISWHRMSPSPAIFERVRRTKLEENYGLIFGDLKDG